MFLTPEELAQLTGYRSNQRSRMCRWLSEQGIPFTINRLGDPVVLRSTIESEKHPSVEPNFDWLKK